MSKINKIPLSDLEKAVKENAKRVTNIVRDDLGVSSTERLAPEAIDKALDVASKPYDVIRKMESLQRVYPV